MKILAKKEPYTKLVQMEINHVMQFHIFFNQ